jgi:hypothetical protein
MNELQKKDKNDLEKKMNNGDTEEETITNLKSSINQKNKKSHIGMLENGRSFIRPTKEKRKHERKA